MGLDGNPRNERAKLAAMVDDRRARVASYKVRGFSVRQTEAALPGDGCTNPKTGKPWSRGVIEQDLQFLTERWQTEAKRDIGEHIARELEKIDEVEREAWAAWRRGIGKKQFTVTERNEGGKGGRSRARVETEELNGDPRYLAILADCRRDRAALLGLNAPKRSEVTGKDGGPIEFSDARERLAAKVEALLAAQAGDEEPGGDGSSTAA